MLGSVRKSSKYLNPTQLAPKKPSIGLKPPEGEREAPDRYVVEDHQPHEGDPDHDVPRGKAADHVDVPGETGPQRARLCPALPQRRLDLGVGRYAGRRSGDVRHAPSLRPCLRPASPDPGTVAVATMERSSIHSILVAAGGASKGCREPATAPVRCQRASAGGRNDRNARRVYTPSYTLRAWRPRPRRFRRTRSREPSFSAGSIMPRRRSRPRSSDAIERVKTEQREPEDKWR